jgi:hypothetical protein
MLAARGLDLESDAVRPSSYLAVSIGAKHTNSGGVQCREGRLVRVAEAIAYADGDDGCFRRDRGDKGGAARCPAPMVANFQDVRV